MCTSKIFLAIVSCDNIIVHWKNIRVDCEVDLCTSCNNGLSAYRTMILRFDQYPADDISSMNKIKGV